MCCRYYVSDHSWKKIKNIVDEIEPGFKESLWEKDILPTEKAPILIGCKGRKKLTGQFFGYPTSKGPVLNARVESVWDKEMFYNGIRYHRVVVPASHFYEWNKNKERNTFSRYDEDTLYMAGFSDHINNEPSFVILTTKPNASMEGVHDRMPLLLEKEQIDSWIFDDREAEKILAQVPVLLKRENEFEQLSFF